jgi:hypothetical protein
MNGRAPSWQAAGIASADSGFRGFVVFGDGLDEPLLEVLPPSIGRHRGYGVDAPLPILDVPASAAGLHIDAVLLSEAVLGTNL